MFTNYILNYDNNMYHHIYIFVEQ